MAKQAATSKKTSKKSPSRATSSEKTAEKSVVTDKSSSTGTTTTTTVTTAKSFDFADRFKSTLSPEALVAEVFGTFILVIVALTATAVLAPLYVGLTLVALVIAIGAISGSHVNPAVTFGLWTARKFPGFAVPFYWIAQALGALAAVVVMAALSGNGIGINLNSFFAFDWGVFSIEVIGTAVFLFGIAAAVSRADIPSIGRAIGVGFALFAALTLSVGLYVSLESSINKNDITSIDKVPRLLRLEGPSLNPAVAFAATEKSDSDLQGSADDGSASAASRLTLGETIVGTFLGAAIGANLYRALVRKSTK